MDWYIPLLIFAARISDVSIGTLRMMIMLAGHKYWSAALSVVEVILWVLAVSWAVTYISAGPLLDRVLAMAGYAAGFAAGIVVGLWLENRVALGYRMVRIVCTPDNNHLPDRLRELGYRVTQVVGRGRDTAVDIAFVVIKRRHMEKIREQIAEIAPKAFVTIERVERPSGADFGDIMAPRRLNVLRGQLRK